MSSWNVFLFLLLPVCRWGCLREKSRKVYNKWVTGAISSYAFWHFWREWSNYRYVRSSKMLVANFSVNIFMLYGDCTDLNNSCICWVCIQMMPCSYDSFYLLTFRFLLVYSSQWWRAWRRSTCPKRRRRRRAGSPGAGLLMWMRIWSLAWGWVKGLAPIHQLSHWLTAASCCRYGILFGNHLAV